MLPNFQGRLPPVPLSEAAKRACQAAMLGAASAKPMRRLLRARNLLKVGEMPDRTSEGVPMLGTFSD